MKYASGKQAVKFVEMTTKDLEYYTKILVDKLVELKRIVCKFEPATSWFLVGFVNHRATMGTPEIYFFK